MDEKISYKRISAEGCTGSNVDKEVAMESVEVSAACIEHNDNNYSESNSLSSPTKTDKTCSDSGVCEIMEEQSTAANIDVNLEACEINTEETTNSTGTPLSQNKTVLSPTINDTSNMEASPSNIDIEESKCENENEENIGLNRSIVETANVGEWHTNSNELLAWPRNTRREGRNYRHSMQGNEEEELDVTESNSLIADGTEEEQMPLLSEPVTQTENSVAQVNTDTSMSGEVANSPSTSENANGLPSVSSSSSFSDDDDIDDDDSDADVDFDSDYDPRLIEYVNEVAEVMNKPKPPYTWSSTNELMRREHGLSGDGRRTLRTGMSVGFNSRFYGSRHVVERMKISHCLLKHSGCVNCLNFNRSGDLLCSGSDDTRIAVWDWAQKKAKCVFKSGHTENIFQTKFISGTGVLDIVSAGRDGQVRRSILPSSGGKPQTSLLYRHNGSVHKLVVSPQNPYEIISAGEDAHIRQKDLRSDEGATSICKVQNSKKKRKIRLFSIAHHPYAPEVCVSGCDNFVRTYDKRNMSKPVYQMCPAHLIKDHTPQVTCAVYNNTGTEVLASYSDEFIYLFNNKPYKPGEYLHRYRGHYNHKTIKGVNFFGPNSEYIISGSDCSNIFFWDKNTEAIVNFMPGDSIGVVNCLEPHPTIPVLATSGLDSSIKIWTPTSNVYPPNLSKLEACVNRNLRHAAYTDEFDDREFHSFIRQFLRRPPRRGTRENLSSSSSSNSDEDSDAFENSQMDGIQCHTQ